jgi:hypothetical protein
MAGALIDNPFRWGPKKKEPRFLSKKEREKLRRCTAMKINKSLDKVFGKGDHGYKFTTYVLLVSLATLVGCATPESPFQYNDSGRMAVLSSRQPVDQKGLKEINDFLCKGVNDK